MYHLVFKKTGEILQSCETLDEIQDLLIDYEHNDHNTNNYFVEQYEIIFLYDGDEDLFTYHS